MKTKTVSKNKDPKCLGIPNICFSLVKATDEREKQYQKQRLEMGFDDTETWSLCYTIARFILPRLKRFIEISKQIGSYPGRCKNLKEWMDILKVIEEAFEIMSKNDMPTEIEKSEIVEKGLKLFAEYFNNLWW